jgi:hypothetical protein
MLWPVRHQLVGPLWQSPNLEHVAIRIPHKGAGETGRQLAVEYSRRGLDFNGQFCAALER